ncbi:CG5872 [Drosophila busckii]|uniref:CG5872 n=2 Tax=Drosophila busckii TaxID=30019 RepID=A0A0M4ERJ9_DROBS|nr:CG5872 [Drosophila busckii]
MQTVCVENAHEILQLKQRNGQLELQQKLNSPKRRRLSPKKLQKQRSCVFAHSTSPFVAESQNSLNMNIALVPSDDEEESIAETEQPVSPYKPWSTRRKFNNYNAENEQPAAKTEANWLRKTPLNRLTLGKGKAQNISPRLKQTRLQFDNSKESKPGDKDIIESSPNLYATLKQASQSRSLLQKNVNVSESSTSSNAATATTSNNNQTAFVLHDDDDSFFSLCPDATAPTLPPAPLSTATALPSLSSTSGSPSVMILTPETQEIVFVDDSLEEPSDLNTMDFMADKVSLSKLQRYEAKLIEEQQNAVKSKKQAKKPAAEPVKVKKEVLTEQIEAGNESTKLPDDFDLPDSEEEEEEVFPRPIIVKQEKQSVKERFNIDCEQCEKYINLMGSKLSDDRIRQFLSSCKHINERACEQNTPDGFWNPLMVSFAADDPRSKVLVERRFAK